ncbi:hypothetical protein ABES25_10020 [Bacillus gobiensis]|uniref:hypothetical protein n=1 Tax=Bacillus gobiensis TaxID=1441095 RepID=UPI003D199E3D
MPTPYSFIKCPPATQPNEPPECEQRRQQISGDIVNASNGWQLGFVNALQDFPTTIDPSNVNSCEGTFVGGFHLAPVEEMLVVINDMRQGFRVNGQPLCPMLIWSTVAGDPTLVFVDLESPIPFTIVPTPSLNCPAYHFCFNTGA